MLAKNRREDPRNPYASKKTRVGAPCHAEDQEVHVEETRSSYGQVAAAVSLLGSKS